MAHWLNLLVMFFFVTFTTNTEAFDAYMVAAQWPPAVCRPPTPCLNPQGGHSFSVHGVWPTNTNSIIRPSACSQAVNFDPNNIPADQRAALDRVWPDLKGGNNEVFWKHQWDDHGKCSGLSQVDYFWKCLKLWELGKLDARLANAEEK
ncbi:ribonuclease 3-like protein [Trifolium pratense]|uniref:Ribonuclease 3-like protein n=1 Tax=Trifolium pratense TaxID=57577 RepID=A0A2K3MSH5_TRIPR|nr:ribonuclease 3-like protein [Trifolium pratense]